MSESWWSSTVGIETAVLVGARISLFYACRKYLLRTLYSDLRSLAPPRDLAATRQLPTSRLNREESEAASRDSIELDNVGPSANHATLPLPTTHTPKRSTFALTADMAFVHTSLSRTIFAWCFAESCMLFLLLMLQGWGILYDRTRLVNWRFSLTFLMFAILLAIPLSFSLLVSLGTSTSSSFGFIRSFRTIIAFLPLAIYLFLLSHIPLPPTLQPSDVVTTTLGKLVVLGTVILGLLSGFGSVSGSWGVYSLVLGARDHKGVPTVHDIDSAAYSLRKIRDDIDQRREEARRAEMDDTSPSWLSRVGATFRGGDSSSQELQGLVLLENQMRQNLQNLQRRREEADHANTLTGRVLGVFGKCFGAYCAVRILSSLYNVTLRRPNRLASDPDSVTAPSTYPDLLAQFLAFVVAHLRTSGAQGAFEYEYEDLASFARQLSLVLVGLIIASCVRVVLRGVTRILRVTSKTLAASLMMLVLAQLMGIYMLSTLVQMRASFPPPPPALGLDSDGLSNVDSSAPTNLFDTLPVYEVFGSLFDWAFLLAAGISVVLRWGAEKVTGGD
ncbi:Abscisic acid G-protein coupled receptor-domain-containing protein [Crepidotus variabilis]|uniref:Abscisic acid G-protein coupled receptor-domain-containing protein n=1 Tax=Crepidotus variabilis TaxID=179855 RepID=A0A9P6EIU7_9AGAR|nr:Abscisic acid G-protein coupled receptor-domain-containing protein [Crepidotus variabilis]